MNATVRVLSAMAALCTLCVILFEEKSQLNKCSQMSS